MTPADRDLARQAILRGRLTIDQVTALRDDCDRTGRPLADLALERGWLVPADLPFLRESPAHARKRPAFEILLVLSFLVLLGLLAISFQRLLGRSRQEDRQALESLQKMAEGDRLHEQTRYDYGRKLVEQREEVARASLAKARSALRSAEEKARSAPDDPHVYLRLVEAVRGFNAWLDLHPEDAAVFPERARAWELQGNLERALADLERAVWLRKDLEPAVKSRIEDLRRRK